MYTEEQGGSNATINFFEEVTTFLKTQHPNARIFTEREGDKRPDGTTVPYSRAQVFTEEATITVSVVKNLDAGSTE